MSNRRAAAVVAGLLLAIGLFLGLSSTEVVNGAREVPCGSAFAPDTTAAEVTTTVIGLTDYAAACDDKLGTRRWIAIPLIGVGGVALLFVALTWPRAGASTAS